MKHLALALLLVAACSKKDKKADDQPGDSDIADIDCEKMTTHNVEVLSKDGFADKSADEQKRAREALAAKHGELVAACEKDKPTKKLTKKQYRCILAAQTTIELGDCLQPD